MTTCLMPPCADHATSTWSAVSLATVDGSAGRFVATAIAAESRPRKRTTAGTSPGGRSRSEEHTSELQSPCNLVCRLLLEKKNRALRRCRDRFPENFIKDIPVIGIDQALKIEEREEQLVDAFFNSHSRCSI